MGTIGHNEDSSANTRPDPRGIIPSTPLLIRNEIGSEQKSRATLPEPRPPTPDPPADGALPPPLHPQPDAADAYLNSFPVLPSIPWRPSIATATSTANGRKSLIYPASQSPPTTASSSRVALPSRESSEGPDLTPILDLPGDPAALASRYPSTNQVRKTYARDEATQYHTLGDFESMDVDWTPPSCSWTSVESAEPRRSTLSPIPVFGPPVAVPNLVTYEPSQNGTCYTPFPRDHILPSPSSIINTHMNHPSSFHAPVLRGISRLPQDHPPTFHGPAREPHFDPAVAKDDTFADARGGRQVYRKLRSSGRITLKTKPSIERSHLKTHQCTVCEKWFVRPSGLATHMNSHSGMKREGGNAGRDCALELME